MKRKTLEHLLQLKQFPRQTLEITPNIGPRSYSPVHQISEDLVAKPAIILLGLNWGYPSLHQGEDIRESFLEKISRLRWENTLLQETHAAGLPVPKPEGVYAVQLYDPQYKDLRNNSPLKDPLRVPALVMEYLKETINIGQMEEGSREWSVAMAGYRKEVERARELGFIPEDCDDYNGLWNPVTQKAFIVDLEKWRRK